MMSEAFSLTSWGLSHVPRTIERCDEVGAVLGASRLSAEAKCTHIDQNLQPLSQLKLGYDRLTRHGRQ